MGLDLFKILPTINSKLQSYIKYQRVKALQVWLMTDHTVTLTSTAH